MPYFVKWTMHGQDTVHGSKVAYPQPAAAMDFACGALARKPRDIWIEDEHGKRVGNEIEIIRHCTKQATIPNVRQVGRAPTPTRRGGQDAAD
ncbi:MAG: hypothetical protein HY060_08115 [Proteobacteria bacterium]|nr:hypothetical protein [Pseudomonadota bacterium]